MEMLGFRLFPTMKKLIYFGDKNSRANWRRELVYKTVGPDFPIILTTYRTAMLDKGWLADYKWKYVVVDEVIEKHEPLLLSFYSFSLLYLYASSILIFPEESNEAVGVRNI
jgi:hypothetical protein